MLLLHFLRQELASLGRADRLTPRGTGHPWLPAELVARLTAFDWPGNVRQLRNLARHLALTHHDVEQIRADDRLEKFFADEGAVDEDAVEADAVDEDAAPSVTPSSSPVDSKSWRQPSQISAEEVRAALRTHDFAVKPTARTLGISRASLYELIDRDPTLRRATEIGHQEIVDGLARQNGDIEALARELEISKHGLLHRMRELGIE